MNLATAFSYNHLPHFSPVAKGKPFIKWVGGKTQLLEQLQQNFPTNFSSWNDVTYIEPMVGGGAMLFFVLQRFPNIRKAIICDINKDLTICYRTVRDNLDELIFSLKNYEKLYWSLQTENGRKDFYLASRERYNLKNLDHIENTTLFFFLNKTCFNGLYRVNKSGLFNVPFGKYEKPTICDEATLRRDSELLKKVDILQGDFEQTINYVGEKTFFYFDPPYRPISKTSSFNDYAKESFGDNEQIRLKHFCDNINKLGYHFLLSNSDSSFFDELYKNYNIRRVLASRNVNSNGSGRGKISEILVTNY